MAFRDGLLEPLLRNTKQQQKFLPPNFTKCAYMARPSPPHLE